MTVKEFYLYTLVAVSLLGSLALFAQFILVKPEGEDPKKRGILFIALAVLSWAITGLYKLVDTESLSIINTITNRVLSMFSNVCMFGALPYFSEPFAVLKDKLKIFRNSEQWLLFLMMFFSTLTILFVFLDHADAEGVYINKYIIIIIDSVFSIGSSFFICYAIYTSIRKYWTNSLLRVFCVFTFSIFVGTQLAFPLLGFLVNGLGSNVYLLTLVAFLVSLSFFIAITITYYSLLSFEGSYAQKSEIIPSKSETVLKPVSIAVDYLNDKSVYELKIGFSSSNSDEIQLIVLHNKKLLKPFASWLLFAFASKNNLSLAGEDMAINKFRMINYWNKESEVKLNQEVVFENELGNFKLKIPSSNITINNISHFQDRFMIREMVLNHMDSLKILFKDYPEAILQDKKRREELENAVREILISKS